MSSTMNCRKVEPEPKSVICVLFVNAFIWTLNVSVVVDVVAITISVTNAEETPVAIASPGIAHS